ncbi:MAG: hypothetical protein IPP94_01685 [Ignavibacteria bacterium]|nr:hypothetical protein [Ignavibacteria bacterium]
MKTAAKLCLLAILATAAMGCGHTNELAKVDVTGATFLYQPLVESGSSVVRLRISDPAPGRNPVVEAIATVGSEVLSGEAQEKLNRAVRPVGVATAVAASIEKTVTTYLRGRTVSSVGDDPAFIVETLLHECDITSSATGLHLHVKASSTIVDRRSGKTVWDYSERHSVALRSTPGGVVPVPGVGTAVSVLNAVEFFRMSEKEIQDAVLDAAGRVGDAIGRELREDYSASR